MKLSENRGIIDSGGDSMSFEMPKGYGQPVTSEEFELIKRNILNEHITQLADLSDNTQAVVNNAYISVIQHGIKYNTEIMHVIDINTGKYLINPVIGTAGGIKSDELKYVLQNAAKDSLITIHNHSNNATFSIADIFTTESFESIKITSAIGHDGSIFELSVGNNRSIGIDELENDYVEIVDTLLETNYYRNYGSISEGDLIFRNDVINEICDKYNWEYRREYYYERPENN